MPTVSLVAAWDSVGFCYLNSIVSVPAVQVFEVLFPEWLHFSPDRLGFFSFRHYTEDYLTLFSRQEKQKGRRETHRVHFYAITVSVNGQEGPSVPRTADSGGPPLSTTVTCSQSWLSGAHTDK